MPWRAFLTPEAFEDDASWGLNKAISREQSNHQANNNTTSPQHHTSISFVPQRSDKPSQLTGEMYSLSQPSLPGVLDLPHTGYVMPASPLSPQSSYSPSSKTFDDSSVNSPRVTIRSTSIERGLCPILTGEVKSCDPEQCGPNAPCAQNLNLSEIEDCADVSCISSLPTDDTATSFNSDPIQIDTIPLIQDPSNLPPTTLRRDRKMRLPRPSTASDTEPSRTRPKGRAAARQAHSIVERRYRENLNGKIVQLHRTLLAAQHGTLLSENTIDDSDMPVSLSDLKAVRKSDVLTEAMDYVHQSEVEMRHMDTELQQLRTKVAALEKLVRCEDCSVLKQLVGLQVQQQQQHHQQQQQQHPGRRQQVYSG